MKRALGVTALLMWCGSQLGASQNFIVRTTVSESLLKTSCALLGCSVSYGLGDPLGQLFLIAIPDLLNANTLLSSLTPLAGIVYSEIDSAVAIQQSRPPIPPALYNSNLLPYAGVNVRYGYVIQPATQIIRLADTQSAFGVTGTGIVAVIDTGVDPDHPVLRNVVLPGYDFTNKNGGTGSEKYEVNQSTAAVVDGVGPTYVNNRAAAVLDQSTAAVIDDPDHAAFGHGTMVSGIIHLVAPGAYILPLKAFKADGTGKLSDILRSVYQATRSNARVINMSFNTPYNSQELKRAIDHATSTGAICVSSAGNNGVSGVFYPAAYDNVIGVASTTNEDTRSAFSNYGSNLVWLAAPGEGVITTYPFGTFASAWGTSFSTPFVSGTAALLVQTRSNLTPQSAASAISQAKTLTSELGYGRLDVFRAVQAAQ